MNWSFHRPELDASSRKISKTYAPRPFWQQPLSLRKDFSEAMSVDCWKGKSTSFDQRSTSDWGAEKIWGFATMCDSKEAIYPSLSKQSLSSQGDRGQKAPSYQWDDQLRLMPNSTNWLEETICWLSWLQQGRAAAWMSLMGTPVPPTWDDRDDDTSHLEDYSCRLHHGTKLHGWYLLANHQTRMVPNSWWPIRSALVRLTTSADHTFRPQTLEHIFRQSEIVSLAGRHSPRQFQDFTERKKLTASRSRRSQDDSMNRLLLRSSLEKSWHPCSASLSIDNINTLMYAFNSMFLRWLPWLLMSWWRQGHPSGWWKLAVLWLGDIGIFLPRKILQSKGTIQFDGNEIVYPRNEWYKLAYAMSIH